MIISRSDFYWMGPHEKLDIKRGNVYVPEGEDYGGVCDRHYALSMYDAISALRHAEIDPKEHKKYIIGKGVINGTVGNNLEWVHYMWLTKVLKINISRYPRSALLVHDISDGIPERWGGSILMNIRGSNIMVKYESESHFLERFNLGSR